MLNASVASNSRSSHGSSVRHVFPEFHGVRRELPQRVSRQRRVVRVRHHVPWDWRAQDKTLTLPVTCKVGSHRDMQQIFTFICQEVTSVVGAATSVVRVFTLVRPQWWTLPILLGLESNS